MIQSRPTEVSRRAELEFLLCQPLPPPFPVWHAPGKQSPIGWAVVRILEVDQFMGYDVVDAPDRQLDQVLVEANPLAACCATPSLLH